jgi:hypothetical protein
MLDSESVLNALHIRLFGRGVSAGRGVVVEHQSIVGSVRCDFADGSGEGLVFRFRSSAQLYLNAHAMLP